jgi:inosine-uridine nucleoside N-ribohydrolase/formylmethanofuran dehydrogenase subunit E
LPARLTHKIIIDTDCALDDMRAVSLLFSVPGITVEAIVSSDGSVPPDEGSHKISSLLNEFNLNKIPIGSGDAVAGIDPPWRNVSRQISWGKESNFKPLVTGAVDLLEEKLNGANEKITIVSLGPLTNIAGLIARNESALRKVERIIWYNDAVNPLSGFNYDCDTRAAEIVFKSGVRIDVISGLDKAGAYFDTTLFEVCRTSTAKLGSVLYNAHRQEPALEMLQQNHFRLYDELVAIYLTNPELFSVNVMTEKINIRHNNDYNVQAVREVIRDMITGVYVSERNVVFNRFPAEREMFNYDVRQIIDSAISRYGREEWKANVMTDEFHGHLGVFSIVGAKMGIRARELLGVGPDELKVITYAGSQPPYSCLNDGIQVSTGATLGMGTISLAKQKKVMPSAVFTHDNRSVRITLKKEYLEKVDADIAEGISKFGLMDDGYWKLIRQNALKYWLEWDRNEIFTIEELVPNK